MFLKHKARFNKNFDEKTSSFINPRPCGCRLWK